MNWEALLKEIAQEFQLEGCFFLNVSKNIWVGEAPVHLRRFLADLFKQKPPSYFCTIRFFKLSEAKSALQFLALMPLTIDGVKFDFIGLIYKNPDQFQELLRSRVLPMYLSVWIHRLHQDQRNLEQLGPDQAALHEALEEKKLYAKQLESRVEKLNQRLRQVQEMEVSLDRKVHLLNEMLEQQSEEYTVLADHYQDLFRDFQRNQSEYLCTYVQFEKRVYDLEANKETLEAELSKLKGMTQPIAVPVESTPAFQSVRQKMEQLLSEKKELTRQLALFEDHLGGLTAEQVVELLKAHNTWKERAAQYKNRAIQLELQLRRFMPPAPGPPGPAPR